jgi:hypothetical protein
VPSARADLFPCVWGNTGATIFFITPRLGGEETCRLSAHKNNKKGVGGGKIAALMAMR